MTFYFTSDQHFDHENIIKYCNRPFKDVHQMNEELVKRWNETVKPDDDVFILGDFCFNLDRWMYFSKRLSGANKINLLGNHEPKKLKALMRECRFKWDGVHFRLCHYPYHGYDKERTDIPCHRYPLKRNDEILLHGHVHNEWKVRDNMINVGVDVWDFRPVSLETIVKLYHDMQKSPESEKKKT